MGRKTSWMSLAIDGWSCGLEAATVVGLRMVRLSAGGAAAADEAERMVREKLEAAAELHRLALTGALGNTPRSASAKTLRHYRAKVRANRRRLGGKG